MIVRPVLCRPFVGRLQELAYLRERRLEAASAHGGFVIIAGEAGVGKSRLIAEFCSSFVYSRWKIGHGGCLEFASRPYGPILEVLARIDERPFELGVAATKREQFDAIVERLATIAAKTAVVVVIEDLHWADAATLDLLAYVGKRLHNLRVLVLASIRADELYPEHIATAALARIVRDARPGRIDLAPLRGTDLQTFMDEALRGFALSDDIRRAIMLAADGNPFFTEELLKSAVEHGTARPTVGARDLPQTVRATLLERLRPFDEGERKVVTQAAVIGRTFHLDLLAATLETSPAKLLATLRRARDFQLVEELSSSVFRFRHGLTRDAIYHDFLGAELQPKHRTIARALEDAPADERTLESLAYHWWAAGEPQQAAHYNERAGDAAAEVHAHEDAIAFYERALDAGLDAVGRGAVIEKIADRRLALAWTNEARATYSAAADAFESAGAYEREARCRVAAAVTAYGTGMPNPTEQLEAMLPRLDGDDNYMARTRVHLGCAWLAATYGQPTRATHHLVQVDSRAIADSADIALRAHNVAAWVAMTVGDLATFQRQLASWISAARATGSLHRLTGAFANGAMCCVFFGLHEEAQEHLERAFRAAHEARSRHLEETVHAFAATCYVLRGDLQRTRNELAQVSPASENHVNATFGRAWGTLAGAALDDPELVERWFDAFEPSLETKPEVEVGGAYAEMLVRRGRAREAATLLHRTLPACEVLRGNVLTLLAIGRHGARADQERARAYLERAAAAPVETPERPALALFDAIACEREGRSDEAAALARDAAEGFGRLRYALLEAQALELAGDRGAALAAYRRCGAVHDVRRLERTRPGQPDRERTVERVLSTRELEIARLAARGRSNIEIARALHITHKTVEKHLGAIYRKLDIASRTQLAPLLAPE